MWTLEGRAETKDPGPGDIQRELRLLKDDRIDVVVLARGESFLQAAMHPTHQGYFAVELCIPGEPPENEPRRYVLRGPAGLAETKRVFQEMLREGLPTLDERFKPIRGEAIRNQVVGGRAGRAGMVVVLGVLGIALVVGTAFAARASGDSPARGALAGGLAILFLVGVVPLSSRLFGRFVPGFVQSRASRMGMPVSLQGTWFGVRVMDPATRTIGRLVVVHLMVWLSVLLGVLCVLAWLAAVVGMGLLLQRGI